MQRRGDVPWNAPPVHLHSDGVMDLDTVPDVLGVTGRRPEAAVVRVLQGRDERSVHALIPDPRILERGFHDVTIVEMGDLPEPSVSLDDVSLLRLQWPVTEYGVAPAGLGFAPDGYEIARADDF